MKIMRLFFVFFVYFVVKHFDGKSSARFHPKYETFPIHCFRRFSGSWFFTANRTFSHRKEISTMYLNPFVETHKNGLNSIVRNNTLEENGYLIVSDPTHPFYGIEKNEEILERFHLLTEAERNMLVGRGYVSHNPLERTPFLEEIYRRVDSEERFGFTMFPTLNCNCRCGYCYQQHTNQPRMTDDAYTAIYSLVQKKIADGVRHIAINSMGGEPTLEAKRLVPFIDRCRKLCLDHGVSFSGSLTTNGTMLDPVLFHSAGIDHFQVTLDGIAKIHDAMRPAANGKPTFQRIVNNLLRIKNENIDASCTIRTNHTIESVKPENLHRFLEELSRNFGGNNRFEIDHTFASDLGGDNDIAMLIPQNEKRDMIESIRALTHEYGLVTRLSRFSPNGGVCYAARSNHLTIMPDLKIMKCSVALDDAINAVGRLLPNGELILNENFERWVSDSLTDEKCQECCVVPICQARFCPLKRIETGENSCLRMPSANYFIRELSIRQSNLKRQSAN